MRLVREIIADWKQQSEGNTEPTSSSFSFPPSIFFKIAFSRVSVMTNHWMEYGMENAWNGMAQLQLLMLLHLNWIV